MRRYAFALPALAAMYISLGNMAVEMPWLQAWLPQAQQLAGAPAVPTTYETVDVKLAAHQTLAAMLTARGIDADDAQNATDAMADEFSPRRLQVGQSFHLELRHDADGTSLEKLSFMPDAHRLVVISPDPNDANDYVAETQARQTTTRTVALQGNIVGSLAASAKRAGTPRSVVNQMTHWLAYDVDFARDLHAGDQFSVLFDAEYDDQGNLIKAGMPQYISLDTAKSKIRMFQFGKRMFHADGRNVVRALLKTPVDGARVTSGFGMRFHPILGYSAMHKGIDFGAAEGAPVLAAGDGVIERANWFSSYGNYVLLKHNSTYETAYGHLSRFARGIHPGVRVHQGQVIAYVGQTGRATGPHLHFEVHKGGIQVNPTKVASLGNDKLEGAELKKFLASSKSVETVYAAAISKQKIRVAENTAVMPSNK